MDICGVVVLYNPSIDVIKNIESYINSLQHLYIVDNSKYDNSTMFDNIKIEYHSFKKNCGLAYALNYGCNLAAQHGYQYVLTMDQDSYFDSNSVEIMKQYIGQHAIVAPNVRSLYWDENDKKEKQAYIKYLTKENIDENWVMTSGSIMNLSDYMAVGGFDTNLFIAHIDIDIGIKFKQAEKKIIVISNAMINQHFGNSQPRKFLGKTVHPSFAAPVRQYYIFRNQIYLEKKYGWYGKKIANVHLWKFVVKALLFEDRKFERIEMMLKGIYDGKAGVMGEYGVH